MSIRTVSFADVAHQTLIFDKEVPAENLVLQLIDTKWVQRLRCIRQTGNTRLVYMFAEHSRFGHSLGVAYLAILVMRHLKKLTPEQIGPYESAVAAAALLHDIGHVAPGSHLAERVWAKTGRGKHERIGSRIIHSDRQILDILEKHQAGLANIVCKILEDHMSIPSWARDIISGNGWNADRGNWSIVDSTMCAVSYGRYNILALIDAFRLSDDGRLVLHESRLDALTHFFVARDSMYRQIYQHRALQAVDALSENIVRRARELACSFEGSCETALLHKNIFCDNVMLQVLCCNNYAEELPPEAIYQMTEPWWEYHLHRWCSCDDSILSDLSSRLRDRRLFKTIRLSNDLTDDNTGKAVESAVRQLGYDPRYYFVRVEEADTHRGKSGDLPQVILDSGKIVSVDLVEPLIAQLLRKPASYRRWLAVPHEVKEHLGYAR